MAATLAAAVCNLLQLVPHYFEVSPKDAELLKVLGIETCSTGLKKQGCLGSRLN